MEIIVDLLKDGRYTHLQIAEMANTTTGYVSKIKSQFKNKICSGATNQTIETIPNRVYSRGKRTKQGEVAEEKIDNNTSVTNTVANTVIHTNQTDYEDNNSAVNESTRLTLPQFLPPGIADNDTKITQSSSLSSNLVPDNAEERKKLWKEFNHNTPIGRIIEKHVML